VTFEENKTFFMKAIQAMFKKTVKILSNHLTLVSGSQLRVQGFPVWSSLKLFSRIRDYEQNMLSLLAGFEPMTS